MKTTVQVVSCVGVVTKQDSDGSSTYKTDSPDYVDLISLTEK